MGTLKKPKAMSLNLLDSRSPTTSPTGWESGRAQLLHLLVAGLDKVQARGGFGCDHCCCGISHVGL